MDTRSFESCYPAEGNYSDYLPGCYEALLRYVDQVKFAYRTENLMILYGDDIFFKDLETTKRQFQFILDLAKFSDQVEIKFATPSEYFSQVLQSGETFDVFEGDLLPYVSETIRFRPISWTGFYASRPSLKQKISETHSLVRVAEVLNGFLGNRDFDSFDSCLSLHHDAVTGTCQPAPFEDYMMRLRVEQEKVVESFNRNLNLIKIEKNEKNEIQVPFKVFFLFNSLAWRKRDVVQIPVNSEFVQVTDTSGKFLIGDIFDTKTKNFLFLLLDFQGFEVKTIFLRHFTQRCEGCSKSGRKGTSERVAFGNFNILFQRGLIQEVRFKDSIFKLSSSLIRTDALEGGAYEYRPMV
jgi:hypothetical protein